MAYIALYRKWRPKNFEDVVGQSHITETLQKAIDTDKVAHAYLFSGPRGTGKTSTAKIFARAMNCVYGPTSHPCNECDVCRHIMSGESMDVVEIDAASNRSIEDIRTLRETIKFMPAEGHKKIYIIDEVHMLTTEAFNALLKTLEEPPSHVIFILATTEPERIPMTILSRCQRYEFRRITSSDIAKRLCYVAEQEHIDLTKGAAHILAVQADGGMRDALSMLDQCVSNTAGTIDEQLVRNLLGLIGRDWLFSLGDAVFQGKGDIIIKAVDDIIRAGKEPQVILMELLAHLRAVMLYQAAPKSDTLAAYDDSMDRLAEQASAVQPDRVFAILGILQQSLLTAKSSPEPRIAVEMGLLMASRAVATSSDSANPPDPAIFQSILDRLSRLEHQIISANTTSRASETVISHLQPEKKYTPVPEETLPQSEIKREPATETKAADTTSIQAKEIKKKAAAKAEVQKDAAPVEISRYEEILNQVCSILDKEKKKVIASCVRNGKILYIGQTEVIVVFQTEFMAKRANREDYYTYVDAALVQIIGKGYHMRAYVENAPELGEYEKKNSISHDVNISSSPPAVPLEQAAPVLSSAPTDDKAELKALQPAVLEDMSPNERTVLEPLLKMVGDCKIYIEHKP